MKGNNVSGQVEKESFFPPATETDNFLSLLSLIRVTLVLIARTGFVLVQFGSVPTESVYDLLLQNVVELSVSLTSYGLLGTFFSFGNNSYKGIIGCGPWSHSDLDLDNVILGFCAVIMGSAVITTFLSSRLHFLGCALLAFTYGGFFQPLLMHWMWHKDGWMNNMKIGNASVDISDYGGGLVIHVSSSCVGLMGTILLGRRLLRLNYIDDCSLGAETPSTILMGYIFIVLGLIGLSLPHCNYNYIGVALINDFLSLAGGSLAAIILEFVLWRDTFNYWVILRCVQGCVSALIVMSSSADVSSPPLSFGITFILTVFLDLSSKFIYKSSLEDYCNILTVHLQSGIWSSLLQPFILSLSTVSQVSFQQILVKFSWHIICTITVINFTGLFFSCVFLLLGCTGFLRNKTEDNCHRRSHKLSKDFKQCRLRRFFLLSNLDAVLEPGISGKIAENPSPDSEVTNLEDDGAPVRPRKSIFTEKTNVSQEQNVNGSGPSKRKRKTKNIYTMGNAPVTRRSDNALSSGDTGDFNTIYKLEDLIKEKSETAGDGTRNVNSSSMAGNKIMKRSDSKLNGSKLEDLIKEESRSACEGKTRNRITKRRSHHKLNKSKLIGNLSKNRRSKRTMINKIGQPVGQDFINYDRKYYEAASTSKIPMTKYY